MRHWNPEAHIGDDGYVLADVKAAVAPLRLPLWGANAPRPGQRGAIARRPAQRGANARRPGQRGANARRAAQRGANAWRPAHVGDSCSPAYYMGHIFPWRCRISASPTRISAYGGKSSSLSPIKMRKKHSKKRPHLMWRCRISASPTRNSA
eukprot:jgi/Tetstr1/437816/TSEL_026456.t1